ncbi:hypothetical protein DFH08DRAFT_1012992, partial [Mycena albidolilacea]
MTTITGELTSISRVPVLQTDGANWLIFSNRFKHFINSKALWGHFDGTSPRPVPPAVQVEIDEWDKHEHEARNYLVQKLKDATLQADDHPTVVEMWDWIKNGFT